MLNRYPKKIIFTAIIVMGLIMVGCFDRSSETKSYSLGQFSKNFVLVEVFLKIESSGEKYLLGVFAPEEPGLHLYDLDFPEDGLNGVGRPTRLEVISGALELVGQFQSDVEVYGHEFPVLDEPLMIYPDGPVTLTGRVEIPEGIPERLEVELSVTYMVCSSAGDCRPPVVDHRIIVSLPEGLQ